LAVSLTHLYTKFAMFTQGKMMGDVVR